MGARARGPQQQRAPSKPELQIEFLAKEIGAMAARHGNSYAAAREWHRGPGNMWDSRGGTYESLIREHVRDFFG